LSDPTVLGLAVYAAVALAASVAAYFALFTQFVAYDDEGTLLVTVKAFAEGDTLYRDVYSIYGPFYYELFGGFFSFTGLEVTTEASRLIVLFLWVGSSLLFGLASQRLSGRLALGVVGMGAAFGSLYVLQAEPMHPQGLCILLLAAFAFLATLGPGRRPLWLGAGGGVLLAALVLTKVNLGAFAAIAAALAGVLAVEVLRRRRWLVVLAGLGFLALPFLLMTRDLGQGWVRELVLIEMLAIGSVLVAADPFRRAPETTADDGPTVSWLLGAAVGFVCAFVVILLAIFLTGPSVSDVWDGVITQAVRVRDVLLTPLVFPGAAVDWALFALAASVLVSRLRPTGDGGPSLWSGLMRGVAGVTILLVVAHIVPLGLNPTSGNPIVLPMLLAWVAALPPPGPPEPTYKRFLRVLLPALAIGETLQVYPVAGSQMGIAAVTFVPVAALCLGDSLNELAAWSEGRGRSAVHRFGIAAAVVTVALAAQFTLDPMLRPAVSGAITYGERESMPFPGTSALHLPPEEVARYSRLVDLLHSHRCTSFIAYPNIDSLYLWSGIEAPPPKAPGAWINALEDDQQQRVVDELKASPRPCAIRSDEQAEAWLHGNPPPLGAPLVKYVFNDFRPVEQVDQYTFMLPKGGA
jgi:hypothetical protein